MVAEAVQEIETPVAEAEAVTPSEPVEETTPAPETDLQDDNLTAVFEELGLGGEATSEGTDATPAANVTDDPYAGLTPQEAAKKAREDYDAELKATSSSREYQNYVAGVSRSFQNTFTDLDRLGDANLWDADVKQAVKDKFASFKGQYEVLFNYAISQDREQQKAGMKQALVDAAAAVGLKDADFASAQDFIAKITEASRTGHLPESQVKAREREISEKAVKAYRKRLIDAGVDIPGVKVVEVPNNPGNGGAGQPKNYAEAEAWHASGRWDNAQMRAYKATHSRN